MATRKQQIANNIRPPHRPVTGGTTAPPAAAKSPATGLGGARTPNRGARIGGNQAVPQAPAQSGAPAAAAQQPVMPWDIGAANDEAAAGKNLGNKLTGLNAGWLMKQQEYGLEGQWADAASNPYSRSALLQRSYNNAKAGTTNSAGQQLYAGSFINAQNSNTHNFNMGRDELQRNYAQDNAQYVAGKAGAEDEYRERLSQAGWDRINAGLEAPLEPAPAAAKPAAKKPAAKAQPRKQQITQNISKGKRAR